VIVTRIRLMRVVLLWFLVSGGWVCYGVEGLRTLLYGAGRCPGCTSTFTSYGASYDI
jgi:hypothetical protein